MHIFLLVTDNSLLELAEGAEWPQKMINFKESYMARLGLELMTPGFAVRHAVYCTSWTGNFSVCTIQNLYNRCNPCQTTWKFHYTIWSFFDHFVTSYPEQTPIHTPTSHTHTIILHNIKFELIYNWHTKPINMIILETTDSQPIAKSSKLTWAGPWENVSNVICKQQRRRSACASAQSDQRLCCSLLR